MLWSTESFRPIDPIVPRGPLVYLTIFFDESSKWHCSVASIPITIEIYKSSSFSNRIIPCLHLVVILVPSKMIAVRVLYEVLSLTTEINLLLISDERTV